ncbi:MAG: exopolysaccharide biosynthesis protein VpsH [Anaerolineae bacterium]
MSHWKATKVGLNTRIKSVTGIPYRARVRALWTLSADEFWRYQADAFRRMYEYARTAIPYYRERSAAYPPMPSVGIQPLEFLASLPVLNRQLVREHNSAFWAAPRSPLTVIHSTSGTTGTPLYLAANLWERGQAHAFTEEWLRRLLGTRSPRTLFLSGFMMPSVDNKELYWVDRLGGNVYLSLYSINAANRDATVDVFDRLKPQLIFGYPSAIHQLALLLGDRVQPSKDQRIALTTAEVLHAHWRAVIEASICRKVYNHYGSMECSHRAIECEAGNMHISPMHGIVELLDDQGEPARPGEFGRVVVTGLLCRSMPLIRYALGDMAESTGFAVGCPCGLQWPTIGRIEGRCDDHVRTRDGRQIGTIAYVLEVLKGTKEAQLVQTDYEKFTCNIVLDEIEARNVPALEAAVRDRLTQCLQVGDVELDFRYVEAIPRGPRNKFKTVVVDFNPGGDPG